MDRVTTKLDGKIIDKCWLVFDFRAVNCCTEGDAYPMLDCNRNLACLKGANYFACLDVKSGFWQLGLTEHASEHSVVVRPDGKYQCKRMLHVSGKSHTLLPCLRMLFLSSLASST